MKRRALFLFLLGFTMAGCSLLPSLRVFQKTIDPKMAEKPAEQTEAERRAAKLIELQLAQLIGGKNLPDYIRKALQETYGVAVLLSSSLGEPKNQPKLENQAAVIAGLQAGLRARDKKLEDYRAFTRKYAGHTIDDTGFDLAPLGGGFGLLLVIAGCIFIPGFGTLVLFVIRRLRSTVQQVAQGVEQFKAENPDQAEALQSSLSAAMDKAHKAIVAREKKYIDWAKVKEVAAEPIAPPPAPPMPATP